MQFVNVSKDQAKYVSAHDEVSALATFYLEDDIAVTFYNPATMVAGMSRSTSYKDMLSIVNEVTDGSQPVEVRLVGGDGSDTTLKTLEKIYRDIELIDNGRKILNIVSANLNETPHPDSFCISAVDGSLMTV